jgi:hypothetical protein
MTPFYSHLPGFPGFGLHSNVDRVGVWATAGVAAAFAAHGFVQLGKRWMYAKADESAAAKEAKAATEEKGEES